MQNCMSETAKTFYGCSSDFVLELYFDCATAEIKHCFISVLFQYYFNCAAPQIAVICSFRAKGDMLLESEQKSANAPSKIFIQRYNQGRLQQV